PSARPGPSMGSRRGRSTGWPPTRSDRSWGRGSGTARRSGSARPTGCPGARGATAPPRAAPGPTPPLAPRPSPPLRPGVPLLCPDRLLAHFVAGVFDGPTLAVLTPGQAQVPWQTTRWRATIGPAAGLVVQAASPYATDWRPGLDEALDRIMVRKPALVVL